MKKVLLSSTVLALLLSLNSVYAKSNKHKNNSFKEEKKIAKKAIKKLAKEMKTHFKEAMKKGGPVEAVHFCSQKASEITQKVNKELPQGVSIKRVSLKPRNPNNKADESQTAVLTSLEALQENGVVLPKMLVQKVSKDHTRVYKPILLQARCVICHGTEDKLNKKAYEAIKEKYPNDKAIGYKIGDLRGAFVVDIVKK